MSENALGLSPCQHCDKPTPDFICFQCTSRLSVLLGDIREIIDELDVQITKQSVGAKSVGGKSSEASLVFDEHASEVLDLIVATLAPWTEGFNVTIAWISLTKAGKAVLLAEFLMKRTTDIARREPNAGQMLEECAYAYRKALEAIDRRQAKIPLGVCTCGRFVHGDGDAVVAVCACGEPWGVQATRERLTALGREQLVTAQEAIAIGQLEGRQFNKWTILSWVKRGKLDIRDVTGGENYYRFGDLLALISGTPY